MFHWKPAKKAEVAEVLGQHLGQIRPNLSEKWQKTDYFQKFYFTQSKDI